MQVRAKTHVPGGVAEPAPLGGRVHAGLHHHLRNHPFFDRNATEITYDKWFGQRLLDRDGRPAAFPLG
ncbi:hypothetical protein ABT299_43790 [Spirillospora sp. NPDC000708]